MKMSVECIAKWALSRIIFKAERDPQQHLLVLYIKTLDGKRLHCRALSLGELHLRKIYSILDMCYNDVTHTGTVTTVKD